MEEPEIKTETEPSIAIDCKKTTGLVISLIIFIFISLGLGGFIVYDTIFSNSSSTQKDDTATTNSVQDVYDKAYVAIEEGSGIINNNSVDIQVGEEGTVGGIVTLKAHKLDFSNFEQYFTERAMKFVKYYFTDTPQGHMDGNYYIFATENDRSYDKKEFMRTIFGQTDQSKRILSVIFYDENTAIAESENPPAVGMNEYIVFKKANGQWKIDMFEEF